LPSIRLDDGCMRFTGWIETRYQVVGSESQVPV
jgi:hypothetical protein